MKHGIFTNTKHSRVENTNIYGLNKRGNNQLISHIDDSENPINLENVKRKSSSPMRPSTSSNLGGDPRLSGSGIIPKINNGSKETI